MNIQTEGVIAASGEVEFPENEWVSGCSNKYFDNSCGAPDPKAANCNFNFGSFNSCFKSGFSLNKYNWREVTLTKKLEDGKSVVVITEGWHNPSN